MVFQLAVGTRIDFLNERFAFTVRTTASFVSGNVYAYFRTLRFGKQRVPEVQKTTKMALYRKRILFTVGF